MSASKIEWTQETWNPVRGCSRISEGCRNCYAERQAARNLPGMKSPTTGEPFAVMTPSGPRWTGKVELIPHMLDVPLKRKKPTTYFVNSMSDLFHESLPDEEIAGVFRALHRAPQHTYQILTKRAERMAAIMPRIVATFGVMPNVWLGVSVEDQAAADLRIPHLLKTPAAVRFLSVEPLLGSVDLRKWLRGQCPQCHGFDDYCADVAICETCRGLNPIGIDWVIVGGESGPGARPMHPDWARSIRDQCVAAGVPFFFKQWGEWLPAMQDGALNGKVQIVNASDAPERVGKHAAGRLLDGREWNEMPV